MLVYAVRMRFDLELPLLTLLGSARDTAGSKQETQHGKLLQVYHKT